MTKNLVNNTVKKDLRYCCDCRFAQKPRSRLGEYICKNKKLPIEDDYPLSPVSPVIYPCATARMDNNLCGKDGKWFEKGGMVLMTQPDKLMGWQIYEMPAEVAPINDLKPHKIGKIECWCNPYLDGAVLVHNAMDEREQYERGERKPS